MFQWTRIEIRYNQKRKLEVQEQIHESEVAQKILESMNDIWGNTLICKKFKTLERILRGY